MTMFRFDQNEEQKFQQYAQAADQGDYSQIDHYEAADSLQQFAQNAPPDLQQRAYAQAFSQMPDHHRQQLVQELPPDVQEQLDPSDPEALAQGFAQVTQQRPNLLQEAGNVLNNPLAKVAVAGLAAVAAKHVWDQHQHKHDPSIGGQGGYGQDQAMGGKGGYGYDQDQGMGRQRGYNQNQGLGGQGGYDFDQDRGAQGGYDQDQGFGRQGDYE
jgi:hypothetical protein